MPCYFIFYSPIIWTHCINIVMEIQNQLTNFELLKALAILCQYFPNKHPFSVVYLFALFFRVKGVATEIAA